MSLQFIIGRSGSDKTDYIYNKVLSEAKNNPDKNYMVIVPEQYTLNTQKKLVLMSNTRAILNIDVLSFNRLAYRIFDELGIRSDKALDDAGKSYIICRILKKHEKSLGVLKNAADKMGYIDEIKSFISELMQYRVKPDELYSAAGMHDGSKYFSEKLTDIGIVYKEYLRFLDDGYVTAENVLELLRSNIYLSDIIKKSHILFDGFTGFTPVQNAVIEELMKYSKGIRVTLDLPGEFSERGRTDASELFYLPLKTMDKLTAVCERIHVEIEKPYVSDNGMVYNENPEFDFLEKHLFGNDNAVYEKEPESIHVNAFKDIEEELSFAACTISRLVREKGYHYNDFAIVCPDVKKTVESGREIFADAGIPFFADVNYPIIKNAFSRAIIMLLNMIERDFSYESVSAYLKSGFSKMTTEECDSLENYVLAKGVRGFKRYEKRWELPMERMDAEDLSSLNEIRERFTDSIRGLRETLATSKTSVSEKLVALYEYFTANGFEERLRGYSEVLEKEKDRSEARHYEIVYRRVMDVFDDLYDLLGEERVSIREFLRLVKAGLFSVKLSIIPTGRDQVAICDMERSRTENIKVLFLIGANDGQIPKTVKKGGILSEAESEILKADGMELSMSMKERAFIQRYYLYLILTKPSKELYISYSKSGGENDALKRSYLIDYMLSVFGKMRIGSSADFGDMYFMQTKSGAYEYYLGNYDRVKFDESEALSAFRDRMGKEMPYINEPVYVGNENLSAELTRRLYGERIVLSVTSLERFASCPYSYFLKYGLKLREREMYTFLPMDFGNILHDSLDGFCSVMDERGIDFTRLEDKDIGEISKIAFENALLKGRNDYLNDTARARHLTKRMYRIFKRMIGVIKTETLNSGYVPKYHEIMFGEYSDIEGACYSVDGGGIILKGKIDRVDLLEEGDKLKLRVVDYKTGSTGFDRLKFENGLQLQLPLYLKIATELVKAGESKRDVEGVGGFYSHVDDPIVDKKDDAEDGIVKSLRLNGFEAENEADMNDKLDESITGIGDRIFSGENAPSPYEYRDFNSCQYCEYRNSCTFETGINGQSFRRLK